ncbi:hypothetical protein PVAG01_08594 [Phlyctema vagabunda]|uniref:Fe2OG dioxygenase domain-containing protein n=1 Tax=Phlyctema vagabunda TaxID=108571 RepID=A0ABR4P9X9_9HELO
MAIPTLDISVLTKGTTEDKTKFSEELLRSLTRYGFVKFVNHGISEETATELFHWTRVIFNIPTDEKLKIQNLPGPHPQRGWSCVGAERTGRLFLSGQGIKDPKNVMVDIREHFDQGAADDEDWPNQWPDESVLPDFRAFMEAYYAKCREVSVRILQALEMALGSSPGTFTSRVTQNASETRLLYYPAAPIEQLKSGSATRVSPHTDLGIITCLFQDEIGGLEVQDQLTGEWVPVRNEGKNEMVVNVSETFQRWTNDKIKAGVHRVTYPQSFEDLQEGLVPPRYSNTCFVKADRHALVGALDGFYSEAHPSLYEDLTALEYHQKRVATAYVK